MLDKDINHKSVPGGVEAAESGGTANKKGGRMARHKKVGKHKGGRRKREHKK
jgi:hypothetical protein